ncbi:hypothetical protein [Traorella massiliensis]|uniref:hypothetical protein n=2 Tax=Traorella massiliensis TaxID=1903263 RepID=UPI0008F8E527|nr:hypothetical protein [Traorella massiliensis]
MSIKNKLFNLSLVSFITFSSCFFPNLNINATYKSNNSDNSVIYYDYMQNEYLALKKAHFELEQDLVQTHSVLNVETLEKYHDLTASIAKYKEKIYDLKLKDDSFFKAYNYTDSQIYAIKNYDGSEEMTIQAASYVIGNLSLTSFNYNSSRNTTSIHAKATATWIGRPMFNLKDKIAVAIVFGDGNNIPLSKICYGKYQPSSGNEFSITLPTRMDNTSLLVCDLPSERYSSAQQKTGTLSKAELYYSAEVSGNIRVMTGRGLYLRQTFQLDDSIGISIGAGGTGLSLTIDLEYDPIWDSDWIRKTR